MRRATKTAPTTAFFPDVRAILGESQLIGIGAIILAFNELEATFDQFFFIVTDLDSSLMWEVSTRVGGLENKISIIRKGVKGILDGTEVDELNVLLGKLWYDKLKTVRDSLAHVRHLNINTSVGQMLKVSKDLKVFNVLVATDVLDKAYAHLITFHREVHSTAQLVTNLKTLKRLAIDDPNREQCEQAIRDCRTLVHQFRTYRLSLPPIPECPTESELRAAEIQVQQAQLALTMQSLGPWAMPPHFQRRQFSQALWDSLGLQNTPLPMLEEASKEKKN